MRDALVALTLFNEVILMRDARVPLTLFNEVILMRDEFHFSICL